MTQREDPGLPAGTPPPGNLEARSGDGDSVNLDYAPDYAIERMASNRILLQVLRNMLWASILLAVPAFWFYHWTGLIGFAFGAAVSYINFRWLMQGVEGLADRVVDRNSREKGGRIILRFLVRYALVAAVAYAIFKSSTSAFRGFLWGLCVPVAALMATALWEGYLAFRRTP